jgi:predicted amidophosphoribosyltransferase
VPSERWIEIPNDCGVLAATLAVGVYSDEADPEAGRLHRRHTDVGAWLNEAKYHADRRSADDALAELSSRMIAIAQGHAACRDLTVVVAAPGSDPSRESFSQRLSGDVAHGLGLHLVKARSRLGRRRAAKARVGNRSGDYVVDEDLSGHRALVVDDVFASGATIAAVAQASLQAGAERCVGLVAAYRLPRAGH